MKKNVITLFILVLLFIGISSCDELTESQPDPKNCKVEVFTTSTALIKTVKYEVKTSGDLTVEEVKYYSDNGFITINNPTKFPMTLNFSLSSDQDSIGIFVKSKVQNGKIEVKLSVTSNGSTITQEDACSQYVN